MAPSRDADDADEERTMAARTTGGIFTPSSAFPISAGPRSEEPDTLRPPAAQQAESFEDESVTMMSRSTTGAPPAPEAQRTTAPLPPPLSAPQQAQAPAPQRARETARPTVPQPGYGGQAPSIRTKEESEPAPRSIGMIAPSGSPMSTQPRTQRWLMLLIAALVALVFVLAAILAWVLYTR
jgi:hypothetical protein